MRRRKIYYLPGFISLLGLPLLLFLMKPQEHKRETRLSLVIPWDKKQYGFSRYAVYAHLKKKKIVQVDLWDMTLPYELNMQQAKRSFIVRELERLQFTHDTSSVLKVTLGSNNTYGDFIWLLNLAVAYGFKRYVFMDDAFYYLPNARPEPPPPADSIHRIDL